MQQNFLEIFSGPADTRWAKEVPECRGLSTATYGTRRPLAGSVGGHRVAQRADQRTAAWQRAHKQFTQVRAAARHKTLLLL